MKTIAGAISARAIVAFAKTVTGLRGNWAGCKPDPVPRIYYANHASHGDFVLIWSAMPQRVRGLVRPVAAAEYWRSSALRRFHSEYVFNAVLI